MKVIVDIDNTICFTPKINGENRYDLSTPYPSRINRFNNYYKRGVEIVYWTSRGMSTGKNWQEFTAKQLKEWGALYSELKTDKPSYDLWIDDKAMEPHHPWYGIIEGMINEESRLDREKRTE